MNLNQLLRLKAVLTAALGTLHGFAYQDCQRELDLINRQISQQLK